VTSGRFFLGLSTVGFAASSVLHLLSFTSGIGLPAGSGDARALLFFGGDAPALALFAGAFVPLLALLVRLRRGARAAGATLGWRAVVALVPPGARLLVVGAVLYAFMNLALSLLLTGGATAEVVADRYYLVEGERRAEVSREEFDAHRRITLRLLSGHLLLFYLVPLTYFRFVDPALQRGAKSPRVLDTS
jgi:hypothetical protein